MLEKNIDIPPWLGENGLLQGGEPQVRKKNIKGQLCFLCLFLWLVICFVVVVTVVSSQRNEGMSYINKHDHKETCSDLLECPQFEFSMILKKSGEKGPTSINAVHLCICRYKDAHIHIFKDYFRYLDNFFLIKSFVKGYYSSH